MALFTISFSSHADDIGKLGKTFNIAEPDLVEAIKSMLMEKQKNGELDKLHNDLKDSGEKFVSRPPGVTLPKAKSYRAFAIDPTYVVPKDIKDAAGKVLYPAGYTYNPLHIKPLTKTLCFINGDDESQVKWLESYCSDPLLFKRILVDGDYVKVSEQTKTKIYFDQNGYLVKHFRIKATPAVVRQSGDLLYVEEFEI